MKKLFLVGVSHMTAPVERRERYAVPSARMDDLYKILLAVPGLSEVLILSTCNRVEVYGVAAPGVTTRRTILEALAVTPGDEHLFYHHEDMSAVHHLFRVAAGLESLALGEPEILGQVKKAYEGAATRQAAGKLVNVLFQKAISVGKQVRSQTGISDGPTSVANLAVTLAERILSDLKGKNVLVIGAGKMAETSASTLAKTDGTRLVVVNRTFDKAQELAERCGGTAVSFLHLFEELVATDIAIFSTGAPHHLLARGDLPSLMEKRRDRPLFLIDLAVPRDVDSAVRGLKNVHLYDIDDLETIVSESLEKRHGEIGKAETFIEQESDAFACWYRAWSEGRTLNGRRGASALDPYNPLSNGDYPIRLTIQN